LKKIRFGVVGCGYVANKSFIPALLLSKYADLISICSKSLSNAETYSKKYNCDYDKDFQTMLLRDDIDAVYVATPTASHEKIILFAAKNNKHILCEKSLSNNLESVKRIISECRKYNVGVFEGFMYQFHRQHQVVKEMIDNNKVGYPIVFHGEFGFPPLKKDNWRYDKALGGGSLLDAGAYTIHSARNFFQREPSSVFSKLYNNDHDVDTHGTILLDFGCTQTATLSFGFNNHYSNTYSIWGTKGRITLIGAFSLSNVADTNILFEHNVNFKNISEKIECQSDNHFLNEINAFCDSIRNNNFSEWYEECLNQAIVIDKVASKNPYSR
jgi:dTDP-3,4-didehydro-2,6-dideoxy-alpha-D-glucose 3-reductase